MDEGRIEVTERASQKLVEVLADKEPGSAVRIFLMEGG